MADGLRVLEVAGVPVAYAGRLLVGLGHRVLRLVTPDGDPLDREHPDGLAAVHLNAGKHLVRLDSDDTADRETVRELVAACDVLLDDGTSTDRWRLDGVPDDVIHVLVTGFGTHGPRAGWRATDLIASAAGGMMALSGRPDGPPLAPPREQAYHLGGIDAAIGVLLAARARRRDGRGQAVDVSLQECVAAALEYGALLHIHEGRVHRRTGDAYPHVPHRLFPAADGWLAGGFGGSPRMWGDLLAWLDEQDRAGDLTEARWHDERTRFVERDHVFEVLDAFTREHDRWPFFHEAQRRQLPWAAVARPDELVDNEHLEARPFFVELDTPQGPLRDVGVGPAVPDERHADRLEVRPVRDRPPDGWFERDGGPRRTPLAAADPDGSALSGVRVLDLTWVLAGPYATMVLADHGADVIKIESRSRPDPTRFAATMHLSRDDETHPDTSGYFNNYNRNKRSVTLNLRDPDAVAVLRDLVAHCDVVIENFSAGTLARWGLDYPNLRELRADVVLVSMAGMGQTGPWSSYVSYADALTALSTLTAQTARPGERPTGITFGLADIVGALHAVLATVDALEHRDATGEGRHVDLAQLEAITSQVGTAVLEAQVGSGGWIGPNRHPVMAPHGAYPCRGEDRWCAIAVPDDAAFAALCGLLGLGSLADDERFATVATRKRDEDELDEILSRVTREHDAWELAGRLQSAGVPAAAVADGRDLVEVDEQLRARRFYVPCEHPRAGTVLHEGIPIRLDRTPGDIRRAAPLLGEHTEEVLRDLVGIDAATYRRLTDQGALE